jgi:hypothetical protein
MDPRKGILGGCEVRGGSGGSSDPENTPKGVRIGQLPGVMPLRPPGQIGCRVFATARTEPEARDGLDRLPLKVGACGYPHVISPFHFLGRGCTPFAPKTAACGRFLLRRSSLLVDSARWAGGAHARPVPAASCPSTDAPKKSGMGARNSSSHKKQKKAQLKGYGL